MSIAGLIVAPPAIFFLRKLVRRVRNIARMQFAGGTRIIETMQEALQGMRMVKAFSLEDEMQPPARRSASMRSKANPTRWRESPIAASPLMETLGGFAIALAMIYGGYRGHPWQRHPGPIRFFPGGVPARLRAGQTAGAAEHRSQQQSGRRPRAVRSRRQPAGRIEGRRSSTAQARDRAAGIRRC